MHKSIVFYYPSKKVGGAQLLFARVANYLSIQGHSVTIIDYTDGYIKTYLDNQKRDYNFICYNSDQDLFLDDPGEIVLVAPLSKLLNIRKFRARERQAVGLFFWSILPTNFMNAVLLYSFYRLLPLKLQFVLFNLLENKNKRNIEVLIDTMISKGSLVFMDQKNVWHNKNYFSFKNEPVYLPIPLSERPQIQFPDGPQRPFRNRLRIGWLGRLDREKVHAIKCLIENVDSYNKNLHNTRLSLFLIGDGSHRAELEELISGKGIEYTVTGYIKEGDLATTLNDHVDILFAMGTSLLEGAALSIPVAMTSEDSHQFKTTKEYRYIWLFETQQYSLSLFDGLVANYKSFRDIIDEGLQKGESVGRACYEYYKEHHSMDNIMSSFIAKVSSTGLFSLDELVKTELPPRTIYYDIISKAKQSYKQTGLGE